VRTALKLLKLGIVDGHGCRCRHLLLLLLLGVR
jgi:hypothetical protein